MANLRWLGHASFEVELAGRTILIDPWFSKNPGDSERLVAPAVTPQQIRRADIICVTHEHYDHKSRADIEAIVARTFAHVVAPPETLAELEDVVPLRQRVSAREGDAFDLLGVQIEVVPAKHPQSAHPVGYVLRGEGKSVYHAGDTYDFFGMSKHGADVALLPIGGTYTMDVLSALNAVKHVRPRVVVPMHYGTFPKIRADVDDFARRVRKDTRADCQALSVGDSMAF
jgi:L-ascorbate metabolism protein UlaG (beta-lactamase superfamily)